MSYKTNTTRLLRIMNEDLTPEVVMFRLKDFAKGKHYSELFGPDDLENDEPNPIYQINFETPHFMWVSLGIYELVCLALGDGVQPMWRTRDFKD